MREALAALLDSISKIAVAPQVAAQLKALFKSIPSVGEILGFDIIPMEAKVAIAVLVVAAALCLALYCVPGGVVAAGAMMKAPGAGGLLILRAAFEANPCLYFSLLKAAGPAAAVAAFVY